MRYLPLVFTLLLPGCAAFFTPLTPKTAEAINATCEARGGGCHFINSPVAVDHSRARRIASRKVDFYPTLEQLDFVDGADQTWIAHRGIVTDGASIPKLFISIVGEPTSPEFVNAAAVHDAYCGIGNERGINYHARPWQSVHTMFYDALRVGGVPEVKAKVMFAAVWLGGPRWNHVGFNPANKPAGPMQAAMRRTKAHVEANNPPIADLVDFMRGQEQSVAAAAAAAAAAGGGGGNGASSDPSGSSDSSSDSGSDSASDSASNDSSSPL